MCLVKSIYEIFCIFAAILFRKKNLVINSDSEEDEQGAKENVPNNQSVSAAEPKSSKVVKSNFSLRKVHIVHLHSH